jgi:hypothetical protein
MYWESAGGQRPMAFSERSLYTFVYVWLYVGKEMGNGLLFVIVTPLATANPLLSSLLLDTLRYISSSAGLDRTGGRPHGPEKGHQVWRLDMGLVYTLLEYCTINISKDLPAS